MQIHCKDFYKASMPARCMRRSVIEGVEKAIKRERASYTLYLSLTKKAKNKNLESFFRTLCLQELKHETLLKEYLRTGDIMMAKEKVASMYIESNLHVANRLSPTVPIFGLSEGFDLALKKERNACEYYRSLAESAENRSQKDFFTELSLEEEEHERLLRKEKDKIFGT